jgi:hypothetical protein
MRVRPSSEPSAASDRGRNSRPWTKERPAGHAERVHDQHQNARQGSEQRGQNQGERIVAIDQAAPDRSGQDHAETHRDHECAQAPRGRAMQRRRVDGIEGNAELGAQQQQALHQESPEPG